MSKRLTNFAQALLAILLGNLLYFVLFPHLPPSLRHLPFQIDLGLALDFAFCLAVFFGIKFYTGRKSLSGRPRV